MTRNPIPALAILAACLLAVSPQQGAADELVLVELFTSQGCSSCPPADEALAELVARDDVLALSMHVDYWDYLGWRDTFGMAETTARQQDYRETWDARYVYTPQMVVDGQVEVRGARLPDIEEAIVEAKRAPHPAKVALEPEGGRLRVTCADAPAEAIVWAARYAPARKVSIEKGENAGRQMTYHNVVERLERLGTVAEAETGRLTLSPPPPGRGLAVWLQHGPGGPVMAVARHAPGS